MRTALSLIVFVVLVVGAYLLSLRFFPFRRCWCCKGAGRHYRKDGKTLRLCGWPCKGTGRRLRLGRWIYNRYHGGRA